MGYLEFNRLMKYRKFSTAEGAMEDKWFATNPIDAHKWGDWFYPDKNYKLVEVTVPTESLRFMIFDPHLDSIGPAYYAPTVLINAVTLDLREVP